MKWMRHLALIGLLAFGPLAMMACSDDDGPTGPNIPDPPAAPTGVTLTVDGQTITVSWSAPAGAESYTVVLTTDGEADRTQANLVATGGNGYFDCFAID